ncbi:MAG: hypothetical protein WCP21_04245, partial [Armatimonadota bacterium]
MPLIPLEGVGKRALPEGYPTALKEDCRLLEAAGDADFTSGAVSREYSTGESVTTSPAIRAIVSHSSL